MSFELIEGYEVLQLCGDFGLQVGISFARFRSDVGQGYRSSVLVDGAITGLKNWKLVYGALRQTPDAFAYYFDDPFPRADYLWDFYCRHQVSGLPFVILCPKQGNYYLADFTDDIFNLELLKIKLWSGGLNLAQRRVLNVSVYDLSLVEGAIRWYDASGLSLADGADVTTLPGLIIGEPPDAPEMFTLEAEELDFTASWDEVEGADEYILELDLP